MKQQLCKATSWIGRMGRSIHQILTAASNGHLYIGRAVAKLPLGSIVLFPLDSRTLGCGLAGIVAIQRQKQAPMPVDATGLGAITDDLSQYSLQE